MGCGLRKVSELRLLLKGKVVKQFHRRKKDKRALNKFAKRVVDLKQLGLVLGLSVVFWKEKPSFTVSKKESLFGDSESEDSDDEVDTYSLSHIKL